ncbi:hypothetical protein WJX77_001942 [Trebouxia sp. C0004]
MYGMACTRHSGNCVSARKKQRGPEIEGLVADNPKIIQTTAEQHLFWSLREQHRTSVGPPNYSAMAANFNVAFAEQANLVLLQGFEVPFEERLGLTNADRLQEYDYLIDQKCRQRDARNLSEMSKYSLQHPACHSADQTVELVPSSSPQCPQTMLEAFAGHMADVNAAASLLPGDPNVERPRQQLEGEAKLRRVKRKRSRFQQQAGTATSEATAESHQPAPAGRHHGNTGAAARACNPGGRNTPALCRACKQPRVGHPKSGCPTNCMKCKNLHDVCACLGKPHSRASL